MDRWKAVVTNILLFLLIFGMTCSTRYKDVRNKVADKTGILVGLCCQFFLMPFIGFLIIKIVRPNDIISLMLLIVCSSPGGSYSNLLCSIFNVDLALSISMTTASSILSIFFLPANLLFYSYLSFGENNAKNIRWTEFATSIAVVICAILMGLYVSYKFEQAIEAEALKLKEKEGDGGVINVQIATPQITPKGSASVTATVPVDDSGEADLSEDERVSAARVAPTNKRLSGERGRAGSGDAVNLTMEEFGDRFRGMAMGFGNFCGIALILFSGFVSNEKTPIWNREPKFFIATCSACVTGLTLTLLITKCFRITPPERCAITIECCYQNVGIATSIAINMYTGDDQIEAAGVPLMYGVSEFFMLMAFGVLSHYMNWTFVKRDEMSLVQAIFSFNQGEGYTPAALEGGDVEKGKSGGEGG